MCMLLQRTKPSATPLLRITSSTCGVMFTNAIFDGMLNVRYSVKDLIVPLTVDAVALNLLSRSPGGPAAVDGEVLPRHVTARIAGQENDGALQLVGQAHALHRQLGAETLDHRGR